MESNENTIGGRIKGNLSKRWQGVKNIFGNKAAKDAKTALEELRKEAKDEYSKLDATNHKTISKQVKNVWAKLHAALVAINKMCDSNVTADENGKGRAYAKVVLEGKIQDNDTSINSFDYQQIKDFNKFEDHVLKLQQIANKTSRTSAIPSVIQDAAKETSRFYAYAYAYACGGQIQNKMKKINKVLQNEKTLWNIIKSKFAKDQVKFENQLDVDSNKVAREIYKQAKTAKIRESLHTKEYMEYFTNSIKDLFGMYTDKEVTKKLSNKEANKIKVVFSKDNDPNGVSKNLKDKIEKSSNESEEKIDDNIVKNDKNENKLKNSSSGSKSDSENEYDE